MMISTHGRYALRFLADLAENQKDGYITLKEIAARQDISEKYLESIAKKLVQARLLTGIRGKGGGYRLALEPDRIGVLDVLEVMEGSLAPVACLGSDCTPCERMASCRTLPLWQGLNDVVRTYLSSYTLQQLIRNNEDGFDYVI